MVSFRVHRAVSFGQHVALVGKSALLGKWNIEDAVPMEWEEGDLWAVELDMHTWEMVRPCLSRCQPASSAACPPPSLSHPSHAPAPWSLVSSFSISPQTEALRLRALTDPRRRRRAGGVQVHRAVGVQWLARSHLATGAQ